MGLNLESGKYPAGELYIVLPKSVPKHATVAMDIGEDPADLFRAVVMADGLRLHGAKRVTLLAPWIAYGRQDRIDAQGHAAAGLAVARALSKAFDRIVTLDAHSKLFRDAFGRKLENIQPKPLKSDLPFAPDLVVAPDAGAATRASFQARRFGVPYLVLKKVREGQKVRVTMADKMSLKDSKILLVDDMVDSGGTLTAAADVLRKAGAKRIAALVSHSLQKKPSKLSGVDALVVAYDHPARKMAKWVRIAYSV